MNLAGRQVVDTIDIVTARAAPAKLEEHGESMRLGGACDGLTGTSRNKRRGVTHVTLRVIFTCVALALRRRCQCCRESTT
jgi:hypothetical protein